MSQRSEGPSPQRLRDAANSLGESMHVQEAAQALYAAALWIEARLSETGARVAALERPLVRYCPGCGSVGDIPSSFRDCCPDGSMAFMVPENFANQCHRTFQGAIKQTDSTVAASPSDPSARVAALEEALSEIARCPAASLDQQVLLERVARRIRALKSALPQDTGSCRLEVPVALGPAAASPSDPALAQVPRFAFEKWLLDVMGLQDEFDEQRNCYKEFACHLAWKAWQAAPAQKGADR